MKPLNSIHLWVLKIFSIIESCPLLAGNFRKIVTFGTKRFVNYCRPAISDVRYCEVSLYHKVTSNSLLKHEFWKCWRQGFGFLLMFSLLIFVNYLFLRFSSLGKLWKLTPFSRFLENASLLQPTATHKDIFDYKNINLIFLNVLTWRKL